MATILSGLVDTEAVLPESRKIDMAERMYRLQPDEQQFRVIISKLATKEAFRETINWMEDELLPRTSTLAASASTTDVSFTVTSGEGNTVFRVNDVVRNMTSGEAFLVTSVSANAIGALTATRGLGSSNALSAQSGTKLMVVGQAAPQGASSGTSLIVRKVLGTNYTQIQRNSFSFTETQTHIDLFGGNEPEQELVKKAIEHGRMIENTLFFGAKSLITTGSEPQGTCGGLLEFITTNVVATTGGALTPAFMDTFLEGPLAYGSRNKAIFCAPRVGTVLSQMYRGLWHPPDVSNNEAFGVKVSAWLEGTYGGTIPIYVKREWADLSTTTSAFGTWAFVVDMDYVRFRPLQGRNTFVRRNIQEPSADSETHEYLTEFSLECATEKAHGILQNVITYSAS